MFVALWLAPIGRDVYVEEIEDEAEHCRPQSVTQASDTCDDPLSDTCVQQSEHWDNNTMLNSENITMTTRMLQQ